MYKKIISEYLPDYLKLKNINYKKSGKVIMLACPFCKGKANVIPNTSDIHCFICRKNYSFADTVKKIEPDKANLEEKEILQYIKELFNIEVTTEKDIENEDVILDGYVKARFNLVPILKNGKRPVEKDWTNKDHYDKNEWKTWLGNGLNIGVKTGKKSNITVIDIDTKEIPEILKNVNTLIQTTNKGYHYFFQYEEDIPKSRIDDLKIDLENDGGQVVIFPSTIDGVSRTFKGDTILKMSPELKKFFTDKITVPRRTNSELVKENIETGNFQIDLFKEGSRSNDMTRIGGVLRKTLSPTDTRQVLHILNNHNTKPLGYREIEAMVTSLERYNVNDDQELAHKILDYLKLVESATKTDIELVVTGNLAKGELKKKVGKLLTTLTKEQYIMRRGRYFQIIKKAEWSESLIDTGKAIDFKMPYFYDVANFNWEDLILIGSKAKYGKTHIGMNMIKRLVVQGIKPYYISLETGSRFAKIALQLGLKEGDFKHTFCADPTQIELEKNAVTIIDWLLVIDKAKTDLVFRHFIEQLDKNKGLLIIFQQLKPDGGWWAPNMVPQFPALAVKYLYEKEDDGTYGHFKIEEVREPTNYGKKTFELPCKYNWKTKELNRLDEQGDKNE